MTAVLSLLAGLCYPHFMATITIRNLDEKIKRALQVRAALNGRSMEAEVRDCLSGLVVQESVPSASRGSLGTAIHKRFAALGGVDLEIPPRQFSSHPANGGAENSFESKAPKEGLGTAIHNLFATLGGVELQIPTRRKSHRPIPTFE
jgi:plasmid stability protein